MKHLKLIISALFVCQMTLASNSEAENRPSELETVLLFQTLCQTRNMYISGNTKNHPLITELFNRREAWYRSYNPEELFQHPVMLGNVYSEDELKAFLPIKPNEVTVANIGLVTGKYKGDPEVYFRTYFDGNSKSISPNNLEIPAKTAFTTCVYDKTRKDTENGKEKNCIVCETHIPIKIVNELLTKRLAKEESIK